MAHIINNYTRVDSPENADYIIVKSEYAQEVGSRVRNGIGMKFICWGNYSGNYTKEVFQAAIIRPNGVSEIGTYTTDYYIYYCMNVDEPTVEDIKASLNLNA